MEEPYVIAALEVACCDPSLQGINPGQITYDPEPERLRFANPGRLCRERCSNGAGSEA
jgi:hypothetical protein